MTARFATATLPALTMNEVAERKPEDELAIVRRAAHGDRGAFDLLVQRYQRRAYAVALGMVQDSEQALDITQEAFVKAFQSLGSFGGRSNFYTWLYRIVVNSAIDHVRRERRERAVSYDDGLRVDEASGARGPHAVIASPERAARRTELKDAISKAISRLPAEQRAAILLREVQGLSYKEIADVLQCSKGTVMSRLHYARRKLRTWLQEDV